MKNLENNIENEEGKHQTGQNDDKNEEQDSSIFIEDSDMVEEEAIEEDLEPPLEILYQDEHYIAVIKPHGLLVHRTDIAEHQKKFVLQKLRKQIKRWIYPIHRLDGPTTGVLVFGLHKKAASKLSNLFRKRNMKKTYYALVRGHAPDKGIIDQDIQKHLTNYFQNAVTKYITVAKGILPISRFGYDQLYYSLVRVQPHTGRMHQIRKHLKHINFPIICDRRYGDWRHNNLFAKEFGTKNLFLLAKKLEFIHPYTKELLVIQTSFSQDMLQVAQRFDWDMEELQKREQEGYYDAIEVDEDKDD
ncbi:MAG: pseudouridine synthase [Chitinophagales bacterium]